MTLEHNIGGEYLKVSLDSSQKPFNLRWFRVCRDTAEMIMNLGFAVTQILDNRIYRITRKVVDDNIEFRFWFVDPDSGKCFPGQRPITILVSNDGDVLNVKPFVCLINPFVYAVAVKLNYLERKSVYKTLYRLSNMVSFRHHKEKEKRIIEFRDAYGNVIKISLKQCSLVVRMLNDFQRYRSLRPFANSKKALVACLEKKYSGNRYWSSVLKKLLEGYRLGFQKLY